MKKNISMILALVVCLFSASIAKGQQVLTSISSAQLKAIFQEEGYAITLDADGDVQWKIDGAKTLVLRSQEGNQLAFKVSYKNKSTTLAKINGWNKSKRFSHSYLDDEGDPVLQVDLELDGGITKARIIDFLETCKVSLKAWLKEVIE